MEKIINWAIEVYSENDYLAWEIEIPKARESFWKNEDQFNQKLVDRYGCVYHSWYGALNDNCNKKLWWIEDLKELEKVKYEYWYKDVFWMALYRWADMIRHWWNKNNPDDPIISYRVEIGTEKYAEALEKEYSIHTWYKWNAEYNADRNDWVLDSFEFWPFTYWHAIRDTKKEEKLIRVDNYIGAKILNQYEVKEIKKLAESWVNFRFWYIYIFKNDIMDQLKRDAEDVQEALKLWITNNEQNLVEVKKWNYTQDVKTILMIMRSRKTK